MNKETADKIANTTLNQSAGYENPNKVNYNGENINLLFTERYESEANPNVTSIYYLNTKSKKFKTKSGMGVGNTRDQLIDAYKNYANFGVHRYKDPEKPNFTESFFTLNDHDAGTFLTFRMENNIVVEISIGIDEGC